MAFSDAEVEQVLYYMGFTPTAENLQKVQEKCAALTALGATLEARAKAHLTELIQLETEIETARADLGGAFTQLKSEGRRFVSALGRSLNLAKQDDIFGA